MSQNDVFLKIDGVEGESTDDKHKGEIEVMGWSFGASNSGSASHGTGMGVGKVNMHDFTFTMNTNKASSTLFSLCATGEHKPKAVLSIRKATGKGGQADFLMFTFSDLMISSYSVSGAGTGLPQESISFNYTKLETEYKPQNADGSLGAGIKKGWDTKTNKAT